LVKGIDPVLAGVRVSRQTGGMKLTDPELRKHYGLLLGIELPWQVKR